MVKVQNVQLFAIKILPHYISTCNITTLYVTVSNCIDNEAFTDIRLCPGVATPLVVVGWPRWPTKDKRDVILKTGST